MAECICRDTGWSQSSISAEIAHIYKRLSSIIHDSQLYQQSPNAVDLVVPRVLQRRQAAALMCIAEHFSLPVKVVVEGFSANGELQ
jgi:hypothetical protein